MSGESEQFMDSAVAEAATSEVNSEVSMEDMDWDNIEETAPDLEVEKGEEDVQSSDDNKVEDVEASSADKSGEPEEKPKEEESAPVEEADDKEVKEEEKEESKALSIEDMDDDAVLSVKVDGEMQEISLKEFKSGISGQKALSQKWSEVDRVHKQNQKDIKDVNDYVNTFSSKMKEGDALAAMEYLGSFSGMGGHQIKASLIKALMPDIERMGIMSQSEIDLEYQTADNSFLKEQREQDLVKQDERQASENLNRLVTETRNSLSIEDNEWNDAIDYLDKHLDKDQAITPELVGEYVQFERAGSQAEVLLKDVEGENLFNDVNMDALQQVILDNPNFTEEDLKEVVAESFKMAKNNAVEEKIGKQAVTKKVSGKQTKSEEQEFSHITDEYGEEVLDFADL